MSILQPEAYIDFEVYEDDTNLVGIAKAELPAIGYLTQKITGAGIGGEIEAVLIGMTEAMTLTLEFRSATDAAATLAAPTTHKITLKVAEQFWNVGQTKREVKADKYIFVALPKNVSPGSVAPASMTDTKIEFSVDYFAAYKDGKTLWEIDPFNQICKFGDTDYFADVRAALGKS